MRLGGIYIDTRAKTDKLKRDLAKAETMTERAAIRLQHHISNINFKAVGVATLAFAGTFAYGMKKAIDAASDLQETSSKFGVVFAGQVDIATKNAKVLNESYMMSREESMKYLASVQDLLVPMGVAAEKAAALSFEVVKLSADLGSFNNMPTAQVMGDIQSALVGNFETMKKYGVVLNETVVSEKALAMGLADTKKELTAADKAQAAYALMVKGSAAAIGDAQRTSDSYANLLKDLKKYVKDFAAGIGTDLLPAVTDIVKALIKVAKWMNEAFGPRDLNDQIENLKRFRDVVAKGAYDIDSMITTSAKERQQMLADIDAQIAKLESLKGAPSVLPSGGGTQSEAEIAEAQKVADAKRDILEQSQWAVYDSQIQAINQATEIANKEIEIEKQKAATKKALQESEAQNAIDNAQYAFQVLGQKSKLAFKIFKGIAIAETAIKTYSAAQKAYDVLMPLGPPVAIAGAAAAIAAGMARVSQIASMQPGGGVGGGGGGGGGGAVGTYPVEPTTGLPEYPISGEERGAVTINIQGDFIGDEAYIDLLVEKINEAGDRDVYVNQTNYAVETL